MEKLIKHKGTHLTISDEPIKVGDWVYWEEFDGEILQVQSMDADYIWFAEGKGCLRAENAYPPYKVLHKLADPVYCVDLNGDIMEECYKVEDAIPATTAATPKLTLTQYEFLKNEVIKTMNDYPELRLGQTWFNELVAHIPAYEFVRGSEFDPFHRDEVLLDLFFHILDEEAYASWTHSDNYKRLHKEWTDNHPAVPVDTSGSELSDFLDSELASEFPTETVLVPAEDWREAMRQAEEDNKAYLQQQAEEVKQKELKLMENDMNKGVSPVESGELIQHVETTNIRLNLTTHRDPLESVKLLQDISNFISKLIDVQIRNLEVSRW